MDLDLLLQRLARFRDASGVMQLARQVFPTEDGEGVLAVGVAQQPCLGVALMAPIGTHLGVEDGQVNTSITVFVGQALIGEHHSDEIGELVALKGERATHRLVVLVLGVGD